MAPPLTSNGDTNVNVNGDTNVNVNVHDDRPAPRGNSLPRPAYLRICVFVFVYFDFFQGKLKFVSPFEVRGGTIRGQGWRHSRSGVAPFEVTCRRTIRGQGYKFSDQNFSV